MVNYTAESKSKAVHHDNYEEKGWVSLGEYVCCCECVFFGKNKELPVFKEKPVCAKYIREIAIVDPFGTCDSAKSCFKWYNQINPIKKWMLEKTGFVFKNR